MLAWFILSLSRDGNAAPEHGFLINGKILDAHGLNSISEETIIALWISKFCLSYQDFYIGVL